MHTPFRHRVGPKIKTSGCQAWWLYVPSHILLVSSLLLVSDEIETCLFPVLVSLSLQKMLGMSRSLAFKFFFIISLICFRGLFTEPFKLGCVRQQPWMSLLVPALSLRPQALTETTQRVAECIESCFRVLWLGT